MSAFLIHVPTRATDLKDDAQLILSAIFKVVQLILRLPAQGSTTATHSFFAFVDRFRNPSKTTHTEKQQQEKPYYLTKNTAKAKDNKTEQKKSETKQN